jgi:uncharacterized protein YjgD (DUF1641 family)
MDKQITLLHEKIDYLTQEIEAQKKQRLEFSELKDDMLPIANHLIKLTIDELAEIHNDFELEDLLFLIKRLLRSSRRLLTLLDQIDAIMDLSSEASQIGKQAFNSTIEGLDHLERQGYFDFAHSGLQILDRIVQEFGEEDLQALGDNIVTILTTVRNLTQPEVLSLADNAITSIQLEPESDGRAPSIWALLRELRQPEVRKGLARMLNLVKSLADSPNPENLN